MKKKIIKTAWSSELLTTDVFLYPCKGDAPLLAALAEAQQKGTGRFWTQNSSLSLLTDKTHDIPVDIWRNENTLNPVTPSL